MNKEQTQCAPSCHLMQYAVKVSAERGLLAASCYLVPKLPNTDSKRLSEPEKYREKEAKAGF